MNKNSLLSKVFHRYFIVALNGMALGLFCTLIIGLIIKQIALSLSGGLSGFLVAVATIAMALTGPVIGIGVAHALKAPKLVILASGVVGFLGAFGSNLGTNHLIEQGKLSISGSGDPLGAFIAVVIAAECGRLISGKTKIDIIVTPFVTIIIGAVVAYYTGPYLISGMKMLGSFIREATELQPFIMGIVVSVVMGIILTLPISSAALSIILGLSGIAAGASTVGCAAQMVGFAVISFKANGWNGLLAQCLGTSMLQVPNIMKKPIIWIPPIIASAILGPVATLVCAMENNPAGGGMGTSGLVGQLMTWQTMAGHTNHMILLVEILLLHFILPAILSYAVYYYMEKKGYVKSSDYQLAL
ncbi:PTS sugar transporter subunit IIC [Gemella sp. oral taxon 928]|uniref:PTS transporter subunit IIC n=1 Tax=Gemella sp. oral taxon 928 TaxID=1785995 RepID=UPI00076829AE|nr:PTS sugar transporter subunit IIC [Gemella sp. oral taxon 928]AME09232.1 PTS sugar transporter subunit IIC [Gemella sp. oral taxon 928]